MAQGIDEGLKHRKKALKTFDIEPVGKLKGMNLEPMKGMGTEKGPSEEPKGFFHRRAYGKTMSEGRKMQSAFKKRKGLDEYGRPKR